MVEETETLSAETTVGRVGLTVTDAASVASFYETTVGLSRHETTEQRIVLGDGETPLLELYEDASAPARPRSAAGLFHTAFRVPSRSALGDALARFERAGQLDGASDHLVSEALYCSDPEGNGVEVYCDRPRSEWSESADGGVEMATELLDLADLRTAAAGAEQAPVGTDVGHVHLEVTSLDVARKFYVDALGMTVRTSYDGALFLAAGDYHHHVGVNVWNRRTNPVGGRGLAWFELVVPNNGALDAASERLSAAGYEVTAAEQGVSVTDPDGVTVRLRS
ncbi:VOC family protein [Haloarcula amylovorans]|uniref:VOC family protein n=1 Tax=Haloarcula amylovorans TaxID=2562280 RepID=UPI001075D24A|nr:VOC family protein [Halomicroarcula amylolytica]